MVPSNAPILADLRPEQLERLLVDSALEEHPAGAIVVREGEPGDAMYVVERGELQAYHETAAGEVLVMRGIGPGEAFGEAALLQRDGRRTASVRARVDVTLRRVSREAFQRVLDADHPLKRVMSERRDAHLAASLARRSALVRALADAPVRVTRRELSAGEVLVRRGDPPGPAFVVVRGSIVILDETVEPPVVAWRTCEGTCVGERSILDGEPRGRTLIAETDTSVLAIDAEDLRALVRSSPEWREHVQALRRVYDLPRLGYVTQFSGKAGHEDTLVSLYDLPDGRRVVISRVVGREWLTADVAGATVAERVRWSDDTSAVELRLSAAGALVGAEVEGAWPWLAALVQRLLEDRVLLPAQLLRFERVGELELPLHERPAEALACACLVVPERRVRQCIAQGAGSIHAIQAQLGCGTVCGGCVPGLAALLDREAWTPATLTAREEIAPGVFQLRIETSPGGRLPATAGQHVVVRGSVQGYPVQRAYTLTRAEGDHAYEIAVKRESRGLFSRWLTGVELPAPLFVSAPSGEVTLRDDMRDVVCLVAGIGVTPAVAIAREIAARGLPTRLHVDFSCRRRDGFAFGDELRSLAGSVRLRTTSEEGHLSRAEIAALAAERPEAWFYLCGPASFLAACRDALLASGVSADRILIEVFARSGGPPATLVTPSAGGAAEYAGWTPDSPIFAPPRRLLQQAHQVYQNTMRANRLLWQSFGRGSGTDERVDPRLPTVPLGAARSFAVGLESFALDTFAGLDARYAKSEAGDPCQPDGDTFVVHAPTPDVVRGSPIRTPWAHVYDEPMVPVVYVRGATAVREVLEGADRFDRGAMPFHYTQQILAAAGPPPADGDAAGLLVGRQRHNRTWRDDRDLGLGALVPNMLERAAAELPGVLEAPMEALARRAADRPHQPFDAHRLTARLALRMVLSVLFGRTALDAVEQAAAPIADVARDLSGFVEDLGSGRAGAREVVATHTRARRAVDGIREALTDARARMTPEELDRPLVKRVLDCPRDDASTERLYASMMPLLVAGHETTGTIMAWALYVLGRDPALRARVVGEIDRWRAESAGAPVGLLAQNHRPETLALLFELYRRYPPVAQTMRTAVAAGEMPPDPATGIGAFRYGTGAVFLVSVVAVHRDPRSWPDPDRFDPTRFFAGAGEAASAEERGSAVRANARRAEEACRFIPFIRGHGTCIGRGLNQVEVFAFLDALLSRFTVDLADPARVVEARGSSISGPAPGSVAVLVRPRPGAS